MENTSKMGQTGQKASTQENVPFFKINIQKLTKKELDLLEKKANYLCLNFDPYDMNMSDEIKEIIKEFELEQACQNPFTFTNTVLQILDLIENEKKRRVH